MTKRPKRPSLPSRNAAPADYDTLLSEMVGLLELARRTSARSVNAIMTATYWEIGRRIVELEQRGARRAAYGAQLIERLASDLSQRFGRGFGARNLREMRRFYLLWPQAGIPQTVSAKFTSTLTARDRNRQTLSAGSERAAAARTPPKELETLPVESRLSLLAQFFRLPWSHYVRLLGVKKSEARAFYESEALRGGWSVRQLDRQIATQFYERTALSRNRAAMLKRAARSLPEDVLTPEQEIKDPFVLEFLGLKDEYSESDLEDELIRQLESFLLELGGDFAFVGRQRRLRIGGEWYQIDLLFFHRRLRCLLVIDLKVGKFTHGDVGQMHLYLNYAREHWTNPEENPPVGLILCAEKDTALAHYALEGLSNKVLAAEYRMVLPDEKILAAELERTRKLLESREPGSRENRNE